MQKESDLKKIILITQSENHFNDLCFKIRALASTWLMASLGGVGFLLTKTIAANLQSNHLLVLLCWVSAIGIFVLWILDLLVYKKMLNAWFASRKSIEEENKDFPQIFTAITKTQVGGRARPGRAPSYNNSFPIRPGELGLGGRYEIAHLWGPGFGDEASAGLMFAPTDFNQFWQNQRMEDFLRHLRDEGIRVGGEVRLSATARAWDMSSLPTSMQSQLRAGAAGSGIDPLHTPFLREVSYRFELVSGGQPVGTGATITLAVGAPPAGSINMSDFDVQGLTGHMSLLPSIDL